MRCWAQTCPLRTELLFWFRNPVSLSPTLKQRNYIGASEKDGAQAQGCLATHSILPEDLIAPIALYSASSRLLYPNNHGAVCTRAQLELVMTLWTKQGKTMRILPICCLQNRPVLSAKMLSFCSSTCWQRSRGYLQIQNRCCKDQTFARYWGRTIKVWLKPGNNSLEWSKVILQIKYRMYLWARWGGR